MTRARELSKLGNANVFTVDSSNNLGIGSLTPDAKLDVTGIVSATSFSGSGANLSGITAGAILSAGSGAQRVVVTSLTTGTMTAAATDADLSWNSTTNTLSVPTLSGNITGTAATFTGNVSVGGKITYDDVTNVDSVGVITARSGIKVGAGESISAVSGTLTYYGDGSNLTGVELGVKNFVASGTIANGATVVINTDGTVGIVTLSVAGPSVGTESIYNNGDTGWVSSIYDPDTGKVVVAYRDGGNSNYGTAVVGTVSGTSISFGSESVFNSDATKYISLTYDTNNNKVVIFYQSNSSSETGIAIVGTVSGTSISFGSAVVFESASTSYIVSTYDITNQKVVVVYRDHGNGYCGTARVGTVSGTSISFGTEYAFTGNSYWHAVTYDSTNSKVIVAYRDAANSNVGSTKVGTVSGTDISMASADVFNNAVTSYISATYDSTNERVVIAYSDDGNSGHGTSIVGTVSGNSISFGSEVVFISSGTYRISCVYDSTNSTVIVSYLDGSSGTVRIGTVSGTSISYGSPITVHSANTNYPFVTYDPTNDKVVVSYQDDSNSGKGTSAVLSTTSSATNLTAENYIGIAAESISNAATGKISVVGGVNSGQSGLTTAQTYYVGQTGILTTTADTPSVVAGTSISDTKILVWRS